MAEPRWLSDSEQQMWHAFQVMRRDLGQRLEWDRSQLSQQIRRMEHRGLVS